MWRLCKLGYQHEPALIVASFTLALLAALPDALLAFWFKLIGEGVLDGTGAACDSPLLALGVSATATWFLQTVSTRVQRRFRDKVTIALESHVATAAGVDCDDRAPGAARVSRSAVGAAQSGVHAGPHVHVALHDMRMDPAPRRHDRAAGVHSSGAGAAGALCAAAGADVDVAARRRATCVRARRSVEPAGPPPVRHGDHGGAGQGSARHRHRRSSRQGTAPGVGSREPADRGRAVGLGGWHTLAWAIFGAGYVGAIVFVSSRLGAPVGDVLLALAAGSRLSFYVGGDDRRDRLPALLDGFRAAPRLARGLRARRVSATPINPRPIAWSKASASSTSRSPIPAPSGSCSTTSTLTLPAGAVVAIVGENGAGKSTLVKLLAKMYEPTSGRILVDGTDLARMPPGDWRARLAGAFQDFFRFEFRARQTVGVGDLPRLDDETAVVTAPCSRAGADDVIVRLPAGLDTQLGPTWPDGVEVSFGQWQKLALARGFMRDRPLVLVLDEPTAALDAETEHALFERYAAAVREAIAAAASPSSCHTASRPCGSPI